MLRQLSPAVYECRQRAADCELKAEVASDPAAKKNFTTDRTRRAFVGHYCNARSFTQWGADSGDVPNWKNDPHAAPECRIASVTAADVLKLYAGTATA